MKFYSAFTFSIFILSFAWLHGQEDYIPFASAVQAGNCAAAEEAIKNGADVNYIDEEWPLFITAVTSNDTPMVALFLNNRVNTELAGPDGRTALMHSLSLKNETITEMLIKAGANLNAVDPSGKNILMYAAEGNNTKLLKKLLDSGFDRSKRSTSDKTAMDYAIDARATDSFRILSRLDTMPLDFIDAVQKGDENLVRKLLKEGASPEIKDKNGKAAIVFAIELGYENIVKILLENGADPNGVHFKKKEQTLFVFAMHNGKYGCAALLLKKGGTADYNYRYSGRRTALMLSIIEKQSALTALLVEKKFSVDIDDDFGNTALIYATENNLFSVVLQLLEKGADPTIRQVDGKTASDIAREKGHSQIFKLLSEAEKKWI